MIKKNNKLAIWTTLSKKTVHKNPWYKIIHEKFITPKNNIGNYFIINSHKTNKSVNIIPVLDDKIVFIYQYRYPIKKYILELPGGGKDFGYTDLQTSKKELEEETGYIAKSWKKIKTYYTSVGVSPIQCSVFLAKDLIKTKQNLEEIEIGTKIKLIPIKQAYEMLENQKFKDARAICALSLARKYIYK